MSGDTHADHAEGLVYMDEHGDTHIFVASNMARAEAQYAHMLDKHKDVKANWRD